MPSLGNERPRHSGILVPGGFGVRGTEGMLLAAKWAREKRVPFLGICLGFQVAVIEWVRNVLGHQGTSPCPDCFALLGPPAALPTSCLAALRARTTFIRALH
jgi:hypothetical protein